MGHNNCKTLWARAATVLMVMALVILFAVPEAFCASPKPGSVQHLEKVTHRLKWIKDIMSSGPIVAQEKGFFALRGLDVEVLPGGFELDPIKLVASGADTFGVAGADTLILAQAKGVPVVAIAMEYQKSPVIFMSKKSLGITQPKDFVGKNVGVKFGTDAGTIYMALMAKMNVDRSTITEIPVKWDMTPFFTGQIDVLPGWIINQPLVAKGKGIDINLIKPEDYGINFYGNTYFTSKKTLEERPDLVENFLAGVVDGWQYVFRCKNESIDVALKNGKDLDRKHQEEEYEAMMGLFASDNGRFCWMTEQKWKQTHDILLSVGMLKEPLDLKKIYTLEPLHKVYQ